MSWQVHVYGSPSSALTRWCAGHDVPLNVFAWRDKFETVGIARDALYLLRPDTYVALADASCAPGVIDRYCETRKLHLGRYAPLP
jgi:hypothetical protein